MPMEWVEPEVLIELPTGETVYHCYKQGCMLHNHFQITGDMSASGWMAFDIRLLAWEIGWDSSHAICPEEIITAAITTAPTLESYLLHLDIWYEGEG